VKLDLLEITPIFYFLKSTTGRVRQKTAHKFKNRHFLSPCVHTQETPQKHSS
jgi:hypothetical protein